MDKINLTKREEAIMYEAFMMGRIYAHGGEKETPVEIHNKLEENCKRAVIVEELSYA